MDSRIAKVALILALIVTAAIGATVGVRVYRYHFVGQDTEGRYLFETEHKTTYERTYQDKDGKGQAIKVGGSGMVMMGVGDGEEADVEQMQGDLEEIARLREQNRRELQAVVYTEVNGRLTRSGVYKYVLADGRTHTMSETLAGEDTSKTPAQIESEHEEAMRQKEQGLRDVVDVVEYDIDGEIWRCLTCRYVLADGREITMGEGDADLPPVSKFPTSEQIREVSRLKTLGQCESLGTSEREMYGKTFKFETFLFTLADGTVLTQARGAPMGGKMVLTQEDHAELAALQGLNAGEDLGTYEEEIDGRVFVMTRKRYLLSDGSEVIKSIGQPKKK